MSGHELMLPESLNNLTPDDVFYGRCQSIILDEREKIKMQTLATRCRMYYDTQSLFLYLMS